MVEMNFRLTHNFWNNKEPGNGFTLSKLQLRQEVSLVIEFFLRFSDFTFGKWCFFLENFICNALARFKDLVDQELVLGVCILKVNMGWRVLINVGLVVIGLGD